MVTERTHGATKLTWLDDESLAYPRGGIRHGRRAKVICPDGVRRICQVGIPSTFFSIPASVCFKKTRVAGFVTSRDGEFYFHAYKYRKNHVLFNNREEIKFSEMAI